MSDWNLRCVAVEGIFLKPRTICFGIGCSVCERWTPIGVGNALEAGVAIAGAVSGGLNGVA